MESNFESRFCEMEQRLNLQSIGEFIQYGSDTEIDKRGFSERLKEAHKILKEYLDSTFEEDKATEIFENTVVYSAVLMDIYFSLGMKAGAKLMLQLTENFESDF